VTPTGDEVLVRRTARRLAWQITVVVATAMLLLLAIVTFAFVRQQQQETDRELRSTAAVADDVQDPPVGSWIVLERHGKVAQTKGLPPGLDAELARARARISSGTNRMVTVHLDDAPAYRVLTRRTDHEVVQVVADLAPQLRARDRLLRISGLAVLGALLAAAGLGAVLGRRAVRPLALALGLQRTFVADASHELRTPLTLLSTRAQVLHRSLQGRADEQAVLDAGAIVEDVQRLGEVVEDLLVAADPSETEQLEELDLGQVLSDAVDSARAHAETAGVALVLEGETHAVVVGARVALRRAVLALVENAVDHTPAGGEVRVVLRRARSEVVVSVADSGPGIADDQRDRVLTRFHSGGQRAGRAHYGLGLALTHDIANRHGGQLRIAPSDRGATFELVLPVGPRKR
jgi:two-component system OmpR family sensor kinase